MSLRNSLYVVESRKTDVESNEASFIIRFNASHPIFAGHFPGHPIVPGACLIQIAEELLSDHLEQTTRFSAIRNLKFRQPVTPEMQVVVRISEGKFEILDLSLTEVYAQFAATYLCTHSDVQ
ncbi:MAG: hypothetical protein J5688_00255 [Paludibacteraceae bacterium]|nr:hypothetical protein [Paludibacteraceae bacterium]